MEIESLEYDVKIEISNMDCGSRFSRLAEAIGDIPSGKNLLLTQNVAILSDVPAYCRLKGLVLVEQGKDDAQYYFLIKKSGSSPD